VTNEKEVNAMEDARRLDWRPLLVIAAIVGAALTLWASGAFAAGGSSSGGSGSDPAAAYIQQGDDQPAPREECPEDRGGGGGGGSGDGSGSDGPGAGDL
jgi:hypothetical protein